MANYKIDYSFIGGTKRTFKSAFRNLEEEDTLNTNYVDKLKEIIFNLEKKTINYNAEYFYNNLKTLLLAGKNFNLYKSYLCNLYNIDFNIKDNLFFYVLRNLFSRNKDKLFQDFMEKFEEEHITISNKKMTYRSLIYNFNSEIYKSENYMLLNLKEIDNIYDKVINKYKQFHKLDENENSEGIIIKMKLEKKSKIIYFGDYHSSAHSLITSIKNLQKRGILDNEYNIQKDYYIVFLGDLVDRGPYGIELLYIVLLLFLINNVDEYRLIILNGNHEESNVYSRYGLSEEMEYQFNSNQDNVENNDIKSAQSNSLLKDNLEKSDDIDIEFESNVIKSAQSNSLLKDNLEKSDDIDIEFESNDIKSAQSNSLLKDNLEKSDDIDIEQNNILEKILKYLPLALFVKIGNKINNDLKTKLDVNLTSSSRSKNLDENIILNENYNYSKWYQFCHGGVDFVQYTTHFKEFLENDNYDNNSGILNLFNIPNAKELYLGHGFMWSDFTFKETTYIHDLYYIYTSKDLIRFVNSKKNKSGRPLFYKNEVKDILNYLNIETIISGHQDTINYGIICDFDSDYFNENFYYNRENDLNLYELKFNNELVKEITFNINMNNIYASIISSATISKGVTHSVYGELFLYEDLSKITFISDCNRSQKNKYLCNKYFLESKADIKNLIFEKLENLNNEKNYIIEIDFNFIYNIESSILKGNVYLYHLRDGDINMVISEDIKIIFQYIILNIIYRKNINTYIKKNIDDVVNTSILKLTFPNFDFNNDFFIFKNFEESEKKFTKIRIHDDNEVLINKDIDSISSIIDNSKEQNNIQSISNNDKMIEDVNIYNSIEQNNIQSISNNDNMIEDVNIIPSKEDELNVFFNIFEPIVFFLNRLENIIINDIH